MVMEEMTLDQIALAAECVTLARLEFIRAVFLSPAELILEQLVGVKLEGAEAETEATRQEKARAKRRGKRPPRKKKKKTPEERDAAILAMAASMGIPIEEEKPPGR